MEKNALAAGTAKAAVTIADTTADRSTMEVIVLGGCVTDLITYTPRFPVPGETLVSHGFHYGYGGKGANSAYMCSRLGVKTGLLASLGDDLFGQRYLDYLQTAGINADQVTVKTGCLSATAAITVTADGENTIAYFPGSADRLTEADVDRAEPLFRQAKVFACVFETPLANVRRGLELARRHGVTTYVNAAPVVPSALPKECLSLIDFLCVNETEAAALVCQLEGKPHSKLADQEIADALLSAGVGTVLMTRGAQGAAFASQKAPVLHLVPVQPVDKVVDTTGAGDAFNGSFIYHLVRNGHLPIEEKVRRACAIASLTVRKKGTQSSYPARHEVPAEYL